MGTYNINNGSYLPASEEEIQQQFLDKYNDLFNDNFTLNDFISTQDGKCQFIVSQEVANLENDISLLAERTTDYIRLNELLLATPITTTDALINALVSRGYNASLRPLTELSQAGQAFIVVEKDDEDLLNDQEARNRVALIINNHLAEGILTQGSLVGTIELSNGQNKEISFELPIDTPLYIRATILYSNTNPEPFQDITEITALILTNFNEQYSIGNIIAPDKYLPITQIPFAEDLVMEWSDDGISWFEGVTDTLPEDYTKKRLLPSDNITVTITQI